MCYETKINFNGKTEYWYWDECEDDDTFKDIVERLGESRVLPSEEELCEEDEKTGIPRYVLIRRAGGPVQTPTRDLFDENQVKDFSMVSGWCGQTPMWDDFMYYVWRMKKWGE